MIATLKIDRNLQTLTKKCVQNHLLQNLNITIQHIYSSIPNYKTSQPSKIAEIIGHTPEISAFDELRYELKSRYKNTKIPQHA